MVLCYNARLYSSAHRHDRVNTRDRRGRFLGGEEADGSAAARMHKVPTSQSFSSLAAEPVRNFDPTPLQSHHQPPSWAGSVPKGLPTAPEGISRTGNNDTRETRETLLDVYLYCARLDALPKIKLSKNAMTGLFEYTIALEEKGIRVCGIHQTEAAACKRAVASFMQAAYDLNMRTNDQNAAKQSTFESPQDAQVFLEWLAQRHTLQVVFHKVDSTVEGAKTQQLGARVGYGLQHCQTTEVEVWGTTYVEAREAVALHAALDVARRRPKLLNRFLKAKKRLPVVSKARKENGPPKDAGVLVKVMKSKTQVDALYIRASKPGKSVKPSKPVEPPKHKGLAPPADIEISHASYTLMRTVPDLAAAARREEAGSNDLNQRQGRWFRLTGPAKARHSNHLAAAYQSNNLEDTIDIRKARMALPVVSYRSDLLQMVEDNVYSTLIGATGSGKTTQVPQLIFEDWCRRGRGADCNIICTQPRVIAATSVANRVADELGEKLRDRVGHHTRNNVKIPQPRDGSITYCTTGIFLQQLQNEPDLILDNVSHLILDEVHERSMVLDFTLAVLKQAVSARLKRGLKVPRILIMSATLNEEVFVHYFKNVGDHGVLIPAPSLSVPGRTFPVREIYLHDVVEANMRASNDRSLSQLGVFRTTAEYKSSLNYMEQELNAAIGNTTTTQAKGKKREKDGDTLDEPITPIGLIAETIARVVSTTETGAILVFLPGLNEINKVEDVLRSGSIGVNFNYANRYRLFKLHSSLHKSQSDVFQPVPHGVRKIILSSPVAETSVTIPEVTYVIDSGQARESHYDQATQASSLRKCWINGSSAKQRAGRAGRVQTGTYLAMYSKVRRDAMPPSGVPELKRADLQSVCLSVKASTKEVDVAKFLAAAIDPPTNSSVKKAMKSLVDIGALTPEHEITSLGRLLSSIPVHPSLAKMIVMGIIFKCLDPIIIAGAAIEHQDLWADTYGLPRSKIKFAQHSRSDLIATYNAFCYLRNSLSPADEAARKDLRLVVFERIKQAAAALQDTLTKNGLLQKQLAMETDQRIGGKALNVNSHNTNVIKAVLVAGLQSNIGRRKIAAKKMKYCLGDRPTASAASSCVLHASEARADESIQCVAFGELAVIDNAYFIRHVTAVNNLTAALFGRSLATYGHGERAALHLNEFLPLRISDAPREPGNEQADGLSENDDAWQQQQQQLPDTRDVSQALQRFRKMLDQRLSIAFDNLLVYTRRGSARMAPKDDGSAAAVAEFVDQVIHVLDSEARAEELRLRQVRALEARTEQALRNNNLDGPTYGAGERRYGGRGGYAYEKSAR
ncbi:hypothetical protein N0V82_007189 [Gnomoniopsis sp. IMI 355080]|nr:hypothetical protein N0V82_007189 [Gnomoniopsis sp. IMI 355080]